MYIYIFMYIFLYFIFNSEKFIFNNFGTIPGYSISIIYYFTPNGKDKALNTLKTSLKTTKKKKWNSYLNNRGSIVLDYNAIINTIAKPWLDWISANKQTTELEIDHVTIKKLDQYMKKPTDLLKLIVNKDNVIPCSVGFWQHKLQMHITNCNWNLAKKMHERDSIVSASLENSP